MFETFQTIINAGGYALEDITQRIKTIRDGRTHRG